jgi:predicted Zn-dependent peptidase
MTVQMTTLPNGLRVLTDRMDTVESASIGVWVGVGARHETTAVNGVSHLLEHMAFKGTRRRSARAIAEEIENVGGHLNAWTSRENTAYFARVLAADVSLAVDILADILQHSAFDPEELERERTVIIQEIGQVDDTPDDLIFDRFQEIAFPGQPLGRPVLGSEERVRHMSRDAIAGYMSDNYTAPAMVLAAAGKVDHDQLVALAERQFGNLPKRNGPGYDPARYQGGEKLEARDLEQAHLVLGFEGVSYTDPDYYALMVATNILGGGMSSRLFQEIRERRGLVYSVYAYSGSYLDGGVFGVYAGTGADSLKELVPAVCEEIVKLGDGATDGEIARTRAQIKSGILMGLESTSARVERLGQHAMVYGAPLPIDQVVAKIEAVDSSAVARVIRRVIASAPTVSALGPVAELERMGGIAAKFREAMR